MRYSQYSACIQSIPLVSSTLYLNLMIGTFVLIQKCFRGNKGGGFVVIYRTKIIIVGRWEKDQRFLAKVWDFVNNIYR